MTSNRQNVFHALQEELLFAVSEGADVQEGLKSSAEKMEFFSIPNITDCLQTITMRTLMHRQFCQKMLCKSGSAGLFLK